jgi:hypothetical protein
MDVVSFFAIFVFCACWWLRARTPQHEELVRLFFGVIMGMAAGAGLFGFALRQIQ